MVFVICVWDKGNQLPSLILLCRRSPILCLARGFIFTKNDCKLHKMWIQQVVARMETEQAGLMKAIPDKPGAGSASSSSTAVVLASSSGSSAAAVLKRSEAKLTAKSAKKEQAATKTKADMLKFFSGRKRKQHA